MKAPLTMPEARLYLMSPRNEADETARNDEHPKGAYHPDGRKLALVGCKCRFCVHEHIDRSERRHPFY